MNATDPTPPHALLESLRARLQARAAGWWELAPGRLEQVAFAASPDLPEPVARSFAEATRSVPLTQVGLGVVMAALSGEVCVSLAAELPPDTGSGLWLRRFVAARSIAVPLHGLSGAVIRVISVALITDDPISESAVADTIRVNAAGWTRC